MYYHASLPRRVEKVMAELPVLPRILALVPHPGSAVAAMVLAEMAAAAAEMGHGATWQNSNCKWIQKRSDNSFMVAQKVHLIT